MAAMASVADDGREQQAAPPSKEVPFGETAGADEHSRQPRGDLRRQQIIEAAVELFATKGTAAQGSRHWPNASG